MLGLALSSLQELFVYHLPDLTYIGSLKLAEVEVFMSRKLAHTKLRFVLPLIPDSQLLNIS
jgi:hypothetical protein